MLEVTRTTAQSPENEASARGYPRHISRWWMRHHRHIGLASMAGSAILVCIIGIILLPIVFKHVSDENERCKDTTQAYTDPTTVATTSTSSAHPPAVTDRPMLPNTSSLANATWTMQGTTVGSSGSPLDLTSPNDILVEPDGSLFIADFGHSRVVYWSPNATRAYAVAGTGTFGSWSNQLKNPTAIAAWNGQLYVSDLGNYRVLAFPLTTNEGSPDGDTLIGHYGSGSAMNQISQVYAMAVDPVRQLLYLSDSENHRVLKLNLTNHAVQLAAGTGVPDAGNRSLRQPMGISVDAITGSLYVADSQNHRIQKFQLDSIEGVTVAGGTSGGASLSQLRTPSGVAVDPAGHLYIADSGNNRLVQWLIGAAAGRVIAGPTDLNKPVQVKFDRHFNLFVVDQMNNRVQRFDLVRTG